MEKIYKSMLFTTEMVRALKENNKTQTRRLVKWSKKIENPVVGFTAFCDETQFAVRGTHQNGQYGESLFDLPYKKGTIIWVKETFSQKDGRLIYRSDVCSKWDLPDGFKWTPSIFMKREYSRLFLEVLKIRVEKIQDISEADCISEGIRKVTCSKTGEIGFLNPKRTDNAVFRTAKEAFQNLWQSVNGKDSWRENPYVFVYNFMQV